MALTSNDTGRSENIVEQKKSRMWGVVKIILITLSVVRWLAICWDILYAKLPANVMAGLDHVSHLITESLFGEIMSELWGKVLEAVPFLDRYMEMLWDWALWKIPAILFALHLLKKVGPDIEGVFSGGLAFMRRTMSHLIKLRKSKRAEKHFVVRTFTPADYKERVCDIGDVKLIKVTRTDTGRMSTLVKYEKDKVYWCGEEKEGVIMDPDRWYETIEGYRCKLLEVTL